jgi:hypothetical protein
MAHRARGAQLLAFQSIADNLTLRQGDQYRLLPLAWQNTRTPSESVVGFPAAPTRGRRTQSTLTSRLTAAMLEGTEHSAQVATTPPVLRTAPTAATTASLATHLSTSIAPSLPASPYPWRLPGTTTTPYGISELESLAWRAPERAMGARIGESHLHLACNLLDVLQGTGLPVGQPEEPVRSRRLFVWNEVVWEPYPAAKGGRTASRRRPRKRGSHRIARLLRR